MWYIVVYCYSIPNYDDVSPKAVRLRNCLGPDVRFQLVHSSTGSFAPQGYFNLKATAAKTDQKRLGGGSYAELFQALIVKSRTFTI